MDIVTLHLLSLYNFIQVYSSLETEEIYFPLTTLLIGGGSWNKKHKKGLWKMSAIANNCFARFCREL